MPVGVNSSSGVYAPNTNTFYVMGGRDSNGAPVATNYRYNVGTGLWSSGAPLPAAHQQGGIAYYPGNGHIFFIGGRDANFAADNEVYEYDPAADTWSTGRAPIPTALYGSGTTIVGQYIYLMGGEASGSGTTTNYRYDIVNNTWAQMADLPLPEYRPGAGAIGGNIYIFGGIDSGLDGPGPSAPSYNTTYVYNIAGNSWSSGPNTNVDHTNTMGTAIGNSLLVVGGGTGGTGTNVVEMASLVCVPTATPTITPTPLPACALAWRGVNSPNSGTDSNILQSVAVVTANDVWAAGAYVNGSGGLQTLTEHWNGSIWSVVSSPNQGTGNNVLLGVTAVSSTDVWALGYYANGSGGLQTLTEHWNGSAWTIVGSPSPGTNNNQLLAVTAVSSTDVWAAGLYANGTGAQQTLTEHWNGSIWSVVSSPNQGTLNNNLYSLTAVGTGDVWAVGSYQTVSNFQTLTEHWNGSAWTIVGSPSPGTKTTISPA